jgi:hypothetical protein
MGFPELDEEDDTGFLAAEQKVAGTAKKIVQLAAGTLGKALGSKLKNIWAHEEVIGFLANLVIETYAMESAILRTRKLKESGAEDSAEILGKLTTLFCEDAMNRIELDAKRIVTGALEGDELSMAHSGLRRIIKRPPINTIQLRREISIWFCENEDWPI